MPDVSVIVGERQFDVACQEGEEHFLRSAAALLDAEAKTLVSQMRHLTEAKMLLLSGLMLADKTAGIDDELKVAERKIAELEQQLAEAQARVNAADVAARAPTHALSEVAGRIEALAAAVEAKTAG